MTWTEIIASYAAIVSTISIGWNLYRDLRDKGAIRVDTGFGVRVLMPLDEPEQCLFVSITNIGRRPIMAHTVGGAWKQARKNGDRFTFISSNELPKLLNPGESHIEAYEQSAWRKVLAPDLRCLWVRDGTGKLWHASKKNIKGLATWASVVNKEGA